MSDLEREGATELRSRTPVPGGPCLWVARGHAGAVTCLAVAPGGDEVLSGGADGRVRRWSRGGGVLAEALIHPGGVTGMAWVSPSVAVSVGADRRAVFLDASLAVLEAHALRGRPTHVACDRASGTVALAIQGGWIGRLDRTAGPEVWSVEDTTTSLLAVGGAFARCLSDRWQCLGTDGAVIAAGDLEALSQGRFSGAHLRPHPDGRRVLAVVEGVEMELYTTCALVLLDPRTGALDPRDAWGHADLRVPWVGSDGEPLYIATTTPRPPVPARLLIHPQASRVSEITDLDAGLLITGSIDGTVRGWDPRPREPAPLPGRLVEGGERRAGEVCTWEPARGELHWWSGDDGRHLRREPIAGAPVHDVALAADGRVVVTARSPRGGGGWGAGLAGWTSEGRPAWETDAPGTCDASVIAAGGAHGAVARTSHWLRAVWADTAQLHDRPTPHLAHGGAAAAGEARAVSWDTGGLVCGWDVDAAEPSWRHQEGGGVHAGLVVAGGAEIALLYEDRGELWVTWLEVRTGAVRAQTARARHALATTLTARPDGVLVATGVVPLRFTRGEAPGVEVAGIPNGYCTMVHEGGRFALHQAHDGARGVIDIDGAGLAPLPDAAGDAAYRWASLGDGPDGAPWLACSLTGGELAIVDLARARVVRRWRAHEGALLALGADAARARLLTAGSDGRVKAWRVADGAALGDWPGPRMGADLVAWTDDGASLWGCDPGGPWVLRRYTPGRTEVASMGEVTARPTTEPRPATAPRWHLVQATEVVVHALDDGRVVGRARTSVPGGLAGGALSPDGSHALLARFEHVELLDVARGRRLTLDAAHARGRRATFLPGDRLLLTGDDARVLAARTGATLTAFPLVEAGEAIAHTAVDPTGRWIAVALTRGAGAPPRGELRVHALDDGAIAWRLVDDEVTALAFAVDGALVVGHAGGALRLRDAATGACRARWDGDEAIAAARSLADGRVVVIDGAGVLRVLAVES